MNEVEYVSDRLFRKLSTESGDSLVKIATILWAVWFARNQKIFEGKLLTPEFAMQWSSRQISEWQLAQRKHCPNIRPTRSSSNQEVNKWCPPATGELKVNVDVSVYEGEDFFSIGMVMRNHQGQYVKGKTVRFGECVSVMEAELVGKLRH
ncbi:uncharacterized protein LOC141684873 [Apium graveolens]|uniref:uncharacterized protein LOC141684873 n=1 Tax=Apium graveolens TaxID=4045 RepID=UPI003D7AB451